MLEGFIGFMTELAFAFSQPSEIDRMLKWTGLHVFFRRPGRVVDDRVTDVAVIGDHLARLADVLAIMTTKATWKIQMADVVGMCLPISLHLREKVSLKDALYFRDGAIDRGLL